MRRAPANALLLLAAGCSTVALAACGGGGNGAASSTTSTAGTAPIATTTTSGSAPAATPAGAAASFLVARGDNSIPEFGREAPSGERTRALSTLAAYLRARDRSEWSRACTYLAGGTTRQLAGLAKAANGRSEGCGPVLAALAAGGSPAGRASTPAAGIAAMRVKGESAFVLYHGSSGGNYVMPMADEGGAWKMTKLVPIAYPPVLARAAAP